MPLFPRKTAIVFFTITLGFASNSAYGQLERNPRLGYGIGYNHMGEQYLKSGICDLLSNQNSDQGSDNLVQAEQAFQMAIEADPTCIEAHLNLARLYHFKQEYDKAVEKYEQVIELAPDDINVLVDMALLQIEMDQADQAARYLEQAKRLARDERTRQHLSRFVKRPGPSEEHSNVRRVNSQPAR